MQCLLVPIYLLLHPQEALLLNQHLVLHKCQDNLLGREQCWTIQPSCTSWHLLYLWLWYTTNFPRGGYHVTLLPVSHCNKIWTRHFVQMNAKWHLGSENCWSRSTCQTGFPLAVFKNSFRLENVYPSFSWQSLCTSMDSSSLASTNSTKLMAGYHKLPSSQAREYQYRYKS